VFCFLLADPALDAAAVADLPREKQEVLCYEKPGAQKSFLGSNPGSGTYPVPVRYSNGRWQGLRPPSPAPPGYNEAVDVVCVKQYVNCNISGLTQGEAYYLSNICSEADMQAGRDKWVYLSLAATLCTRKAAQVAERRINSNVTCCNTPFCNKPDPAEDATAHVMDVPDSSPASLECYISIEDKAQPSSGDVAPPAAVLMQLPDIYETSEVDYTYVGQSNAYLSRFEYTKSAPAVCARFRYIPCKVSDIGSRYNENSNMNQACRDPNGPIVAPHMWAPQWAYRRMSVSDCLLLQQSKWYDELETNVTCCSTPGCNAPDPQQDPDTQTLSFHHQPTALPQADNITCYKSVHLGETISGDVPPAVHPVTLAAKRAPFERQYYAADPVMCYSAKVNVCAAGNKDCSAEDEATGLWVWQYDAMPLSQCYRQQWAASTGKLPHLQHVNCCGSDLCNMPNPADDNTTQVISADHALLSSRRTCKAARAATICIPLLRQVL
jgi:hypothetical protein